MPEFLKNLARSNLQNRLLLFFIIFATLPVLLLGGLTLYLMDLSHRRDVSSLELQLIDQKIEEIEKFFSDTLGILELRVGFHQKSEIELSQQKFLLNGLLEENRAFEEVSFINLEGKETSKKGRAELPESVSIELQDVSGLQKFMVAKNGENFQGDVYYTLSGPFVNLAAPVRNRNNEIIQILSAEVNLSQIVRSIETSSLGFSGWLVLVDKDGALIAQRSGSDVFRGQVLLGFSRIKRVLEGGLLDGLSEEDRYKSFFGRVPVVGAGKKISGIGWALLAEWPLEDADALIREVRGKLMTFALIALVAVTVLAPLFARRLLEPIRELEAGTAEIEKGNFEKRLQIKTKDELEELGAAFNRMAQGLKRLQELKNEFTFIAAHELRAPITAITGYLSMILEGSAGAISDKLKEFLQPIQQANDRLVRLVDDILEIARSEAGRITIEVFAVDIREVIKITLQELQPMADEKKVTLSYKGPQNLLLVLADPARLREVMANFITNGIKYNNPGGFVKIYHEIQENKVVTQVEDNGLGIPEKEQEHVFEKFFRSEIGKEKTIQGTGLGLFITKELVLKMGGKIWFRSQEGRGTCFSFSLPRIP
jgi:signal transduction histidine kinase